jgi:hypothetical protein
MKQRMQSHIIEIIFDPLCDFQGRIQGNVGFGTYPDGVNAWEILDKGRIPQSEKQSKSQAKSYETSQRWPTRPKINAARCSTDLARILITADCLRCRFLMLHRNMKHLAVPRSQS